MNVLTFTLVSPLMAIESGYSDFVFGNRAWLGTAIAVALVFMLLSFASYRQSRLSWWMRILGVLLRSTGIGLLLFCLLEPMATLERPKPQANSFAILVDRSKSMDVLNQQRVRQGATSLSSVLDDSSTWLNELTDDFRVRRFLFDSSLEPIEAFGKMEYSGNDSALYSNLSSLKDRFQGKPLAGVLLLTDGHDEAVHRVQTERAGAMAQPQHDRFERHALAIERAEAVGAEHDPGLAGAALEGARRLAFTAGAGGEQHAEHGGAASAHRAAMPCTSMRACGSNSDTTWNMAMPG